MTDVETLATKILADALGLDTDSVSAGTALGVTPQWDSLAHMRIILALEKSLGQLLSPDDILSITGLATVTALLEKD